MPPLPQQEVANRQCSTLDIDLDDLEEFSKEAELVDRLERNTQQYLTLLAEAADNILPQPTDDNLREDVFDVLLDQVRRSLWEGGSGACVGVGKGGTRGSCGMAQCRRKTEGLAAARLVPAPGHHPACLPCRLLRHAQRRRAQDMTRAQMEVEGRGEQQDPHFALPPSLLRRYEVLVRPRSKASRSKLRDISAECIGSLVTFKGIVTQVRRGGAGAALGSATPAAASCCIRGGARPPCSQSALRGSAADVQPASRQWATLQAHPPPSFPPPTPPLLPQVSDVRPLLTVATYLDDQSGFEIYQEVGAACLRPRAASCTLPPSVP